MGSSDIGQHSCVIEVRAIRDAWEVLDEVRIRHSLRQRQGVPGAGSRDRKRGLGCRVWLGNGLWDRSLGRAGWYGRKNKPDQAGNVADTSLASTALEAGQRAGDTRLDLGWPRPALRWTGRAR